ncbi:MAG: phosphopantothenoylcysteine decarboxylase [Chrysiogenales bacterium]|nr:MAG: phosphopantothenoylcysteine decarboxylase [Chrysiogenales bacterium]
MLLRDRKMIVTGGPTREWLDPVRFISNPSTGRMGVAIAEACFGRSKDTVFIHGPIYAELLNAKKFRCTPVETTEDMLKAVLKELEENSVLIMAAAPADYSPENKVVKK